MVGLVIGRFGGFLFGVRGGLRKFPGDVRNFFWYLIFPFWSTKYVWWW